MQALVDEPQQEDAPYEQKVWDILQAVGTVFLLHLIQLFVCTHTRQKRAKRRASLLPLKTTAILPAAGTALQLVSRQYCRTMQCGAASNFP
jgi:hypothetical protein